ncbi:MAG: sulfotransferase [Spirochaetales bacterium]
MNIIINGFAHGGTNIAVNLLLSHPDLCYPGETHKALAGGTKSHGRVRRRLKRLEFELSKRRYGVGVLSDPYALDFEEPFAAGAAQWLRATLEREKRRARHESHNLWKLPGVPYRRSERAKAGILLKNNNTVGVHSDLFQKAFPDARTICLFRHPFALMESQVRKGRSPELILNVLSLTWSALREQLESSRGDHLMVRFEDILADPHRLLGELYSFAGLDVSDVAFIRLQHKAHYGSEGQYAHHGAYDRQVVWNARNDFDCHLDPQSNIRAIERLDDALKHRVAKELGPMAESTGYLMSPPYVK